MKKNLTSLCVLLMASVFTFAQTGNRTSEPSKTQPVKETKDVNTEKEVKPIPPNTSQPTSSGRETKPVVGETKPTSTGTRDVKEEKTVTVAEKEEKNDKKDKDKKDKADKRAHAEEKSNGNAFSGKGNGGDKDMVEPSKKDKDNKKGKKDKK